VASVLANDSTAVLAVLAIGCIWLAATAAERMELPAGLTIAGEAALIGMASALALTESYQVLTVLAFPPFTAACGAERSALSGPWPSSWSASRSPP
jgi:hypothetical protein